ncbi:CdaR family protein [Desulfosporosinus sp. PR]|uniref:CdaR family protein n=1 Tax=Candidatus Desulfosporosinus nitrosoreducens TaxID=3401928 RepID=UPI0027EA58EF|nr:CdaR family protein [Desulfosporosinus sp. PR]MDQ7092653.1 CdaR family protein [Desulfosporosinus sp. PR]
MVEILRRNLGVKLLSFLFAILFWVFVMNQGTTSDKLIPDQTLTVPLVVSNLPQNMIVMSQLPLVSVRFQGINPSANIKDIYAQIDLTGGTAGEHSYKINVNAPTGTNVVDVQPASVKLVLDSVQEKTVAVQAVVMGNPADGFQAGTPIVKPSAVNVRGPSTIVGGLDKVVAEVSVAGADDTVQTSRPISFRDKEGKPILGPNPSVDILTAYPSSVDVIVPVMSQGLASKMIPLKVTTTGTVPQGKVLSSLLPSPASVQVTGTPQALKGFDSLSLGPIDLSALTEDKTFQIPLDKITLPAGVSFLDGTTISVIVQIGPGPIQKTITSVPVEIRNVGAGLDIDQPIAPINVVVEGLPDTLKNVTADQIQLWVDASGQAAGSYTNISVFWQLPPGVTMPTTPQVSYSLKTHG